MKLTLAAMIAVSLGFAAPAHAAQRFESSLGAVSSLCTFQSELDYAPALLADFSKPTSDVNSFAMQGLIVGLAGSKGALDEFVVFAQNRLDAAPVAIDQSIDGGAFDFHGQRDELKIAQSASPTSECDIVHDGQTFRFELRTIDPHFTAFWMAQLDAMTGDVAPRAKSLSSYIAKQTLYWMLDD